ncbi:glycosyltransferase [Streptomyces sp. 3MP-14]|uniref:Glycosyltransferase n=1 Tax=Streptomyces mimosae TaxID=2586635 RepID=A0A5N6ASN5_9ACTN|nr:MULTISPECIES: glycosyltransferase [Streptomyces]KAB8171116.1 glycosyltransferase [Streptomyces mimosae]KAB8179532.1 glycosyltransferase [Streptomyces sp. 3MP-14]
MNQRLVTVVTAVHAPSAPFLAEAYESIRAQELPAGWDWQWVIQEDGVSDTVRQAVPEDPRISFGQGRPGGPGVARTMGLARAEGAFLKVLDSDDMLTPGTLARDLAVLTRSPSVGWTTSRALDLFPDGSTKGFDQDPQDGPLERGEVFRHWRANDHRPQVIPGSLCVRTELVLALGGWMALPASEDTGLLLALNTVSRGWFIREPGLYYRKWPGQVTSQAPHVDKEERAARAAVAEARVRALEALGGWRFPSSVATATGG